ncbi:MAG: GTP-binding protein [Spirochaetales bacterium]|nr:GTP-binding protein [Spirochaetales bacterium]
MDKITGEKGKIPLYLLGGFLGSGKTSLLNSILSFFEGQNVGVIINEFGDLNIDARLIPHDSGINISELNGGQIFCSCLSGSFIKSIAAYKDHNIQLLIVEASGLAKPAPLKEIIDLAGKTSDHFFEYRGMIGVVDAQRFETLDKSLKTLGEQLTYSDRILINKIDLVDDKTIERIMKRVNELNPHARISTTSFGRIEKSFLETVDHSDERVAKMDSRKWAGWGEAGRPKPISLIPGGPVSEEKLKAFLAEVASESFRIKGFLASMEGNIVKVDCTGSNISIEKNTEKDPSLKTGLVLLIPGESELPDRLVSIWESTAGTKVQLNL